MVKTLDAKQLANMFLAGAKNLQDKKEWINELNVFPVPDGDTGTNMTMTIMSAVEDVQGIKEVTMDNLSKALSSGSLKGARGNSGVILSQLLRGFSKVIREYNTIDVKVFAEALTNATETAYKAVMKPKEGTILTVARGMSEKALEICEEEQDIVEFLDKVLRHGQAVLDYTPELLPVLKEAGVVDSGGQGLMQILYGAYNYLTGKEIDISDLQRTKPQPVKSTKTKKAEVSTADIKFGYCTEFIVMLSKELDIKEKEEFRNSLLSLGDSLVFVADEDMVKVHVHTNHPGLAFEKGLEYGELTRMKVDNMREEHREIIEEEGYDEEENLANISLEPMKDNGFVAVSVGSGLSDIFKSIGVDTIVEGGQTMNPSTEDIINAINTVNAKNVYVLPNNKNILLAAQQACQVIENKNAVVIPTATIPEGISAVINFEWSDNVDDNKNSMIEAIKEVKSGEVTYSIRDTHIDGFDIKKDDYMGIHGGAIRAVGSSLNETTLDLINNMVNDDSSIISIYYGADVKTEDVEKLQSMVEEKFKDCDIEVIEGSQPVYYYLISVE